MAVVEFNLKFCVFSYKVDLNRRKSLFFAVGLGLRITNRSPQQGGQRPRNEPPTPRGHIGLRPSNGPQSPQASDNIRSRIEEGYEARAR